MDRKRDRLWIGLLVGGALLAVFLLRLQGEREKAQVRSAREQAALARLQQVAAAQRRFHETTTRYGWAADLASAGLLDAAWVSEDGAVRTEGYRIDVLLPYGLSPRDFVQIAPRGAGKTNPRLEARHFAIVARPERSVLTGYRSYCIDETGALYVNEGVAEVAGENAPPYPELHITQSQIFEFAGRRWWYAELTVPDRKR